VKENKMGMRKKSKTTNEGLTKQINLLNDMGREKKAPIWRDVARRLSSSRKNRPEINVSRIGRHTKANDVVAVPGKLLGAGAINHPVTVVALAFSSAAREKISSVGGRCISFEELISENPKGAHVRIMS
jgi:large subunit ribosomal protein L18e